MVRILIVLALITALNYGQAQNKKICVTVDDLPTVHYGMPELSKTITQELVSTFLKYDVPAIGYVNEGKLYVNSTLSDSQVHLLDTWLKSGLELGNHTYSHANYHQSTFDNFTREILKGELITKSLAKKYKQEYQYFRHPYLRIGQNKAKADSLSHFLKQKGYIEAPVTIDNSDYLFAHAYARSLKKQDSASMKKIGEDYVRYMMNKMSYFESISDSLFNRNINHILLTHASLLNAHYMESLIKSLEDRGYEFISQGEALKDKAYQTHITHYGEWGISWLERWALSQGKKGSFFKNDVLPPDYIERINK